MGPCPDCCIEGCEWGACVPKQQCLLEHVYTPSSPKYVTFTPPLQPVQPSTRWHYATCLKGKNMDSSLEPGQYAVSFCMFWHRRIKQVSVTLRTVAAAQVDGSNTNRVWGNSNEKQLLPVCLHHLFILVLRTYCMHKLTEPVCAPNQQMWDTQTHRVHLTSLRISQVHFGQGLIRWAIGYIWTVKPLITTYKSSPLWITPAFPSSYSIPHPPTFTVPTSVLLHVY